MLFVWISWYVQPLLREVNEKLELKMQQNIWLGLWMNIHYRYDIDITCKRYIYLSGLFHLHWGNLQLMFKLNCQISVSDMYTQPSSVLLHFFQMWWTIYDLSWCCLENIDLICILKYPLCYTDLLLLLEEVEDFKLDIEKGPVYWAMRYTFCSPQTNSYIALASYMGSLIYIISYE